MNKETLALILVMGIAGFVILAFVLNDAYGVHEPSPYEEIRVYCLERTAYTQHYVNDLDESYDTKLHRFDWCVQGLLMEIHETQYANLGYLNEILKEEQKQTALLDQMNCYSLYNNAGSLHPFKLKLNKCGDPLNYTGVWTP